MAKTPKRTQTSTTTEDTEDTEEKTPFGFAKVTSVSSVVRFLLLHQLPAHHTPGVERRMHVEVEAGGVVDDRLRRRRRKRDAVAREAARTVRQHHFARHRRR